MKQSRLYYYFTSIALFACVLGMLSACGGETPTPTAEVTTPTTSLQKENESLHIVVAVQGELSLQRKTWTKYAPARFGTYLRNGDLLRLGASSQANVVCADLTLAIVKPGVDAVPCPLPKPIIKESEGDVLPGRIIADLNIPKVLGPRKTKLLDANPTFRWMGVTGATGYRVKVIGPNLDWTSPDLVPGTEFDYPADAPPLTPGNSYKVIVTAGDTSSEEGESEDTSFAVLAASESEEVRENEAKIRSLNLGDAPTRLLIAHLYSSNNLYAEAIEQLEPLARDRQNTESALLLLLARLNRYTALELQAEDYYLGAAQRSKQVGDIDGEALAQHELGELYDKTLGRSSAARQSYSRAIELYRNDLGDEDTAKEIEEKLKQLK